MAKDFYKVLGCAKQATAEELKKAYRKLALKWHPDRCAPEKKDEAQAKFQEIGEAFEVLSDPEKRKIYDQVGAEGMQGPDGGASAANAGFSGFPGGHSGAGGANVHFSQSNAEDIFRSFFGTSDPMAGLCSFHLLFANKRSKSWHNFNLHISAIIAILIHNSFFACTSW